MAVAASEPQSYGAPSYDTPSYNTPSYNTPSYNTPAYNTPAYNTPSYNAPSYNAPSYNSPSRRPSYKAPSSDYGIPSGPVLSYQPSGAAGPASGYTAPCTSYGCSSGAAAPAYQPSDAPVYVYQPAADPGGDNGLGGLGVLKPFLLPLGGLALLAPLAFLAITTLFPATTIINPGRRRRRAANMTLGGGEEAVLASYMEELGPTAGGAGLQRDMVARYLGCGGRGEAACLQLLACLHADSSVAMDATEREVAGM
jgi:hypothetical protein